MPFWNASDWECTRTRKLMFVRRLQKITKLLTTTHFQNQNPQIHYISCEPTPNTNRIVNSHSSAHGNSLKLCNGISLWYEWRRVSGFRVGGQRFTPGCLPPPARLNPTLTWHPHTQDRVDKLFLRIQLIKWKETFLSATSPWINQTPRCVRAVTTMLRQLNLFPFKTLRNII